MNLHMVIYIQFYNHVISSNSAVNGLADHQSGLDKLDVTYNEYAFYNKWYNRQNNYLSIPGKDLYSTTGQGNIWEFFNSP